MGKNENQRLFSERRQELVDRQLSNSEALDKAILTLSSGGLAISISFIRYIVDFESAIYTSLLFTSWTFFALAVVSTIVSYLVGQRAIDDSIDLSYQYYIEDDDSVANVIPLSSRINDKMNLFSSLVFVLAVILIVVFVALNINHEEKSMTKPKKTGQFITDSAPVPKLVQKSAKLPKQQPKPKPQSSSDKKK